MATGFFNKWTKTYLVITIASKRKIACIDITFLMMMSIEQMKLFKGPLM